MHMCVRAEKQTPTFNQARPRPTGEGGGKGIAAKTVHAHGWKGQLAKPKPRGVPLIKMLKMHVRHN